MGIVRYMAKEMAREIGNKSKEFYEFVLPPVDMFFDGDSLTVLIDMPGFDKKDVKLTLYRNVLAIKAQRPDSTTDGVVCKQRPNIIDKKILLPIRIDEEKTISSAKLSQGVLTIKIPSIQKGKQISIE